MMVERLVPAKVLLPAEALVAQVASADTAPPFADDGVELCAAVSARLFADPRARRRPELQALAFWLRRAEVLRLRRQFEQLADGPARLVPVGTVFHVAPANVDTMFVYSWALSMLLGNRNVVRVSGRESASAALLVEALGAALGEPAAAGRAAANAFVRYGHEAEPTAVFSAACDLRVIWGGDATVRRIREAPLAPHGRELTFPNRYSMAAVRVEAWQALDEAGRAALAERFFNDTYWFDQLGCSSPRLVIWVGEAPARGGAARDLAARLAAVVRTRGYAVEPATAITKLLFSYRALLDGHATGYQWFGNELTVLPVERLGQLNRQHCGGGLLFQFGAAALEELVPFVTRQDQTLTQFGFEPPELQALVTRLNGRGLDRIVEVGQALDFSRFWDGYDLLQAFCRRVVVEATGRGPGSPARGTT